MPPPARFVGVGGVGWVPRALRASSCLPPCARLCFRMRFVRTRLCAAAPACMPGCGGAGRGGGGAAARLCAVGFACAGVGWGGVVTRLVAKRATWCYGGGGREARAFKDGDREVRASAPPAWPCSKRCVGARRRWWWWCASARGARKGFLCLQSRGWCWWCSADGVWLSRTLTLLACWRGPFFPLHLHLHAHCTHSGVLL